MGAGVAGETGGVEKAIAERGRKAPEAEADDEANAGAGVVEGEILVRLNSALRF